ncbi:MAG: bifunctional DNA-formamidopyrimidine glycosylase/DNA-(apurinic or apyrimidinic site) lyase [Planctomycetaceae bacterium]
MPELPEVETMVRGIRPHVEGRIIAEVRACPCSRRPITLTPGIRDIARRARGARVTEVRRLAKRVVLTLDSGDAFVIEPRMTGLMLVTDPPSVEHLRIKWQLAPRSAGGEQNVEQLWFWDRRGLGTVRLLDPAELDQLANGGKLGPDPIGLSVETWSRQLARTARPIKVALLDQSLVAGIGNLYASEILHVARIHPERPANQLTRAEIARLQLATDEVLLTAIKYEGSTLGDGTYRNALNQNGSYQNAHRVYARADERCLTCRRGAVLRSVQAQRSTFHCPVCQRLPRSRPPSPQEKQR